MRALVVYESILGNTRLVAEVPADGLSSGLDVDLVEVAAAPASADRRRAGGPRPADPCVGVDPAARQGRFQLVG